MNGATPVGTQVALIGVVATSPKFLASKGSMGACTWGVFVSEPVAQAVPYSGALILNPGARAQVDAAGIVGPCASGTDLIPEDTAPGDVFSVNGTVITYVKTTCTSSPVATPEVRITNVCSVHRDATGHSVPTPATVPDISELTNLASESTHRKWTGVLIKLDNVSSTGPVDSTGAYMLTNGVRVRDRIYQPETTLFAANTTWSWIVGISHLDVCTWSIEPRNPCSDFNPKSENCP
jgi:hypothetical protein